LQIIENGKLIKNLDKKNPISIMIQLCGVDILNFNCKLMEEIFDYEISFKSSHDRIKNYEVGCFFLSRIPSLDPDDVQQLLAFILESL